MNHSKQDWLQNLKPGCCPFKFRLHWYMIPILLRNGKESWPRGPGFQFWNKISGDEGARTPDLGVANAALSQLSYIPTIEVRYISNPLWGVN